MRRRDFIAGLSGAAALPFAARAQQAARGPLVEVLVPQTAAAWAPNRESLVTTLGELGRVEGRNIRIVFHYADGVLARLPVLAAEIAARKPDLIIAASAPSTLAVNGVTRTVPVVIVTIPDPVALGVVKSIARPGGNVTGFWMFGGADALIGKRLDLLKEVVPGLSRVGVMVSSGDPSDEIALRLLPAAARSLGISIKTYDVRTDAELDAAFGQAVSDGMQGAFVNQNPFFFSRRARVAELVAGARLPAVYGYREFAEAGGLMSYGSSLPTAYRHVARMVDKILKGAKPADLPVEQADTFELVVNNRTAKALRIKISEAFLLRADEVIE